MACGLPAVATRSLGPAEIIEDGRTGWLVEPDEAALAAALIEAVEDARERKQRGRAAREAACKRFTWPNVAAQLAAVLEDAVAEARQAPAIDA
jgi:glycosyltransferase involved in cell wall biosynthesis